ncbi:hypothetical protein CYLTODRAFT_427043 [Cylindrobasidium torrendii FP15055 ss-10]|uniref:DUF6534 domain-containing protein n=1 Tax=Cylindrobasidium torrendii FP15055 ss-10 TaxID=1314674 RepID=A0A0D7AV68_9AGAR|nr:hypothetical protein CYLTODRAFT_427043 [Cylindrobasidium torrendii FP15055 ss-10]
MAPPQIPGVNIPLMTGPLVLGYMWGYCLYGMLVVQTYMYYETFKKDRIGIKAVVWSIFILETVFTIMTTIAAWNQYGDGWGDLDTLTHIDWSWEPLPPLNGLLATIAQGFYIWRIYNLTKSIWLPILLFSISLMQCCMAWYYAIYVSLNDLLLIKLLEKEAFVSAWLAGSATCDILITVSLVYILSRRRTKSSFDYTSSLVGRLIRYTMETGFLTTFGAIVELILWLTMQTNFIHFIFFLIIGRLYSNALMGTLNARSISRSYNSGSAGGVGQSDAGPSSSFWRDANRGTVGSLKAVPGRPAQSFGTVHITTEVMNDGRSTTEGIYMKDFTSPAKSEFDKSVHIADEY